MVFENGHQSEFFWKRLSISCESAKKEVFEYDDEECYRISFFLAFWCARAKTIEVEHAKCGLVFFLKKKRKKSLSRFEKYADTCAREAY